MRLNPTTSSTDPHCSCCGSSCACTNTICVIGCNGKPVPNASIQIAMDPDPLGIAGVTGQTGCVSFCLPRGPGNYRVKITASGYVTYDATVDLECNGRETITLTPTSMQACFQWYITGCCGGTLPGATLSINGETLVTDDSGFVMWCTPPGDGTYPWTVDGPCARFVQASGTITVQKCTMPASNAFFINLPPAPGFICGFHGPYPLPPTLAVADPKYGGTSITFDAASNAYSGTISGLSWPGSDLCPASTGFTITYSLIGRCQGALLVTSYPYVLCGDCAPSYDTAGHCVGGFFHNHGGGVPQDPPFPGRTCECEQAGQVIVGSFGPPYNSSAYTWGSGIGVGCSYHQTFTAPASQPPCSNGPWEVGGLGCDSVLWTMTGPATIVLSEMTTGMPEPAADAPPQYPPLLKQAANLVGSMAKVVASAATGGPVFVPLDVLRERASACLNCEHNGERPSGGIRCTLCGCTGAKLELAAMECPDSPPRWPRWERPES